MLLNTRAQVVLADPAERFEPLRSLFTELAAFEPVRRHLAETVTGIGTRYDIESDEPHPLLGRLAPNLSLEIAQRPSKLSSLLHGGRGVLLDLGDRADLREAAGGWSDRVAIVAAVCPHAVDIDALLIRPDGYTAWVAPAGSDAGTPGLRASLAHWFGAEQE